jgi:hypothetical protein
MVCTRLGWARPPTRRRARASTDDRRRPAAFTGESVCRCLSCILSRVQPDIAQPFPPSAQSRILHGAQTSWWLRGSCACSHRRGREKERVCQASLAWRSIGRRTGRSKRSLPLSALADRTFEQLQIHLRYRLGTGTSIPQCGGRVQRRRARLGCSVALGFCASSATTSRVVRVVMGLGGGDSDGGLSTLGT